MIYCQLHKTLNTAQGKLPLNVDFTIAKGEFISLYGPSGAGKTTILRMIAGLLAPDDGILRIDDEEWFNRTKKLSLTPQQRNVGMVFQAYTLFPNMTIRENLAYALHKGQDKSIIDELIQVIDLEALQHRKPDTLSGGQQQRVALARALVQQPRILLLDEPLAALDKKMRATLQDYLLKVHRKYGLTTILVSHDIAEVAKLSDRVLVLDQGIITKQGPPLEVFSDHQLSGKFQFMGEIIAIEHDEVVHIVSVLVANTIVKVVAESSEINQLNIGDQVVIASKAFNPVIQKVN